MSVQTKVVQTVCGGCSNYCAMNVTLKDEKIIKIEGVFEDPMTRGVLCSKGLAGRQIVYDPRRLKYPLRRAGKRGENNWARITWDEALEEIAYNFNVIKENFGPRAIGFFNGQGRGWRFNYLMYQRLAHAFGTEPGMGASECWVPRLIGEALTYGGMPSYPDYEHTRMIVFWGIQPAFSKTTQLRHIFDARDRGAKIVVIDPLRFHIGARADEFIRLEPGTDLALALALLQVIVETDLWDHDFVNRFTNDPGLEKLRAHLNGGNRDGIKYTTEWAEKITGVSADTIRRFATELATTPGVIIHTGHGIEGRINVTQTARAIAIIRLVIGNIDAPGGNLFTATAPKLSSQFTLNELAAKDCEKPACAEYTGARRYNPPGCNYPLLFMMFGCLPTPDLMEQMKKGEIKAALFQAGNPLVMLPNSNEVRATFSKLNFFAVIDPYLSETARELADIVLPAASYLERTEPEWVGFGRGKVQLRRKLVTIGESLPDWQIVVKLGQKLGLEKYFPAEDIKCYTDLLLEPAGITYEMLEQNPGGITFGEINYKKYEQTGFSLPGGMANIYSEVFAQMGFDPLPVYVEGSENIRSTPELARDFPLTGFTGRGGPMYVHSRFRTITWLRELCPEPKAMINTKKAGELGIADGDLLDIESPRGKITIKAEVTNIVGENCVYVPGGWADANFNELGISSQVDPISSQQNYKTFLVRVSKNEKGKVTRLTPAAEGAHFDADTSKNLAKYDISSSIKRIEFDASRCVGCFSCQVACKQENDLPPTADCTPGTTGPAWRKVIKIETGEYGSESIDYLSVSCLHCSDAPCIKECPTSAIIKRAEDGIVIIDRNKCTGCKLCMQVCPWGALQVGEDGVVQKCNLCLPRLEQGKEPACVTACPTKALRFVAPKSFS